MGQMRHLTGLNLRLARRDNGPLGPVNDTFLPGAALKLSAALLCLRYPPFAG